jgi:RES domain-containing protein
VTPVYRILRRSFAKSPLDGEGGYRFGGRWSSPGTRLAYTSEHLSLAMLEYFVHLDPADPPKDLVVVRAEIPDGASRVRLAQRELPANWRQTPAPPSLARFGDHFVRRRNAAILIVPSVLAPSEFNWLINPRHPEFRRIRLGKLESFRYDARIVGSEGGNGPRIRDRKAPGDGPLIVLFCKLPPSQSAGGFMAYTILRINRVNRATKLCESVIYISQEYLPHKERDATAAVLPNQQWQHPEPEDLYYCRLGTLKADRRSAQLFESSVSLGIGQIGGHGRLLDFKECPWLRRRTIPWAKLKTTIHKTFIEEEERRAAEEARKAEARRPIHEYCRRCDALTEQCKDPNHRGSNRCMDCCGGVADRENRRCVNCLDLPYREKREAALGHKIVYEGEEPPLSAEG